MIEARPSFRINSVIGSLKRWPLYLSVLFFIAYFARLAYNAMFVFPARADFWYFWVAGKVWAHGGSPYTPVFAATKTALVGKAISDTWLYPPNWYPICRLFAEIPLSPATHIWRGLILVSLLAGVLGWRAYRAVGGPLSRLGFMLILIATVAAGPTSEPSYTAKPARSCFSVPISCFSERYAKIPSVWCSVHAWSC